MNHWAKRLFAISAALLLTGCLWGPGKFASDLTVRKDGSFVLDYKGEVVLQLPPDATAKPEPWKAAMARCRRSGKTEVAASGEPVFGEEDDPVRPCTAAELAKLKTQFESGSDREDGDQAQRSRRDGQGVRDPRARR